MSASPYSRHALKRSAAHFLIGKAISALFTLIILFWLVRLLTVEEYGAYVTLIAGMEFSLAIASFGLPWVAARYLPEFRLHASGEILAHFVWKITAAAICGDALASDPSETCAPSGYSAALSARDARGRFRPAHP